MLSSRHFVTRLSLTLPSGLEISFEGDDDALDEFRSFLRDELPIILESLPSGTFSSGRGFSSMPTASSSDDEPRDARSEDQDADGSTIDIPALAARIEEVKASTDIERATLMAFFAKEAGLPGLDSGMADWLYTELGIPKPGVWRATFQNAKRKGYLKNVKQGVWKPTYTGENFARHGIRPGRKRSRSPSRKS